MSVSLGTQVRILRLSFVFLPPIRERWAHSNAYACRKYL